jgi:hypothetical protein
MQVAEVKKQRPCRDIGFRRHGGIASGGLRAAWLAFLLLSLKLATAYG